MLNKKIHFSIFLSLCALIPTSFAATVTTSVSNVPLQKIGTPQVMQLIPQNTALTQTGESGVFYKVTYNNLEGYIYKGFTAEGASAVAQPQKTPDGIHSNSVVQVEGSKQQRTITWSAGGKTFTSSGYEVIYPKFESQWLKFSSSKTSQINPIFGQRLEKLAQDLGEVIPISSGFRSMQDQINLIQAHLRDEPESYAISNGGHLYKNGVSMTAAPGHSRHQYGIAVDVKNTGIGKTIRQMSNDQLAPYGLYKPMSYESWHIEPVESRNQ